MDEHDRMAGVVSSHPRISEDGSTAIVFLDESTPDLGVQKYVALVWPLDDPLRVREVGFLEGRLCNQGSASVSCDHDRAEASVRPVNELLAKHRWVEFQELSPWAPGWRGSYCDRTLRVRAAGYVIEYRSPRLSITAPDGTRFVDRADATPAPRSAPTAKCPSPERAFVGEIGLDVERRAMFVVLGACTPRECIGTDRYLFFRLPKPAASAP